MTRTIKLSRREEIVAVVPAYESGPGWTTDVVWVHIVDMADNRHRCEALFSEEQNAALANLFAPGAAMCEALRKAVSVEKE